MLCGNSQQTVKAKEFALEMSKAPVLQEAVGTGKEAMASIPKAFMQIISTA